MPRATAIPMLLLALTLGACRAPGRPPPFERAVQSDVEIEAEVIDRVNAYRRARRLPALVPDRELAAAAREHARWMARRRTMDHSGFDRRFRKLNARGYRGVGENVAMNYGLARPAAVAFEGWRQSPGHHKNMVARDFALTGAGVARSADGSVYIAQLFGYR